MSTSDTCDVCGLVNERAEYEDHDCYGDLRRQHHEVRSGITSEAGWDSIETHTLADLDRQLTELRSAAVKLMEHHQAEADEATRRMERASTTADSLRRSLNEARAALRERFKDIH